MCSSVKVLVTVPSRVLLEQFAEGMPDFCKVGTNYNSNIDMASPRFVAVSDSVQLLKKLEFEAGFVDEGHHPMPPGMPSCKHLFKFSATHKGGVDFRFSLGEAIEQGVLCEYDLTVPVTTEGHPYICLANLLLSQAGRFRRVLAYCNSIAEAKRFQQVLDITGLAAWHINGHTARKARTRVMNEFSGELQKPVHVLVTVQVLGEGVNIPNADTCMFVEPRSSYVSIIQAIGRVLRPHSTKPLSHVVLPAIAVPSMPETSGAFGRVLDDIVKSPESEVRLSSSVDRQVCTEAGHNTTLCPQVTAEHLHHHPVELPVPLGGSAAGGHQQPEEFSRNFDRRSETEPNERDTNADAAGNPSLGLRTDGDLMSPAQLPWVEPGTDGKGRAGQDHSQTDMARQTVSQAVSGSKPVSFATARSVKQVATEPVLQPARLVPSHAGTLGNGLVRPMLTANQDEILTPLSQDLQVQHHRPLGCSANLPRKTTMSKLKLKAGPGSNLLENGHANTLDRFLEAIAKADSRFAGANLKHLQSRLWVIDCRLRQPLSQKLLVSSVLYQLALILQQRDAWDLNLRAVEQYASQNRGRLPRQQSPDLEERRLGCWLREVGALVGRQQLAAARVQKLCKSSCSSLRLRVAKWLDAETAFERCVKMLRQFVRLHGRMPVNLRTSGRREGNLIRSFEAFVARANRQREERLQDLENQGPIIAQWARSMRAREFRIPRKVWNRQFGRLIDFLERKDRLPTPTLDNRKEYSLYVWLCKQRNHLEHLPSDFRDKLFDSHQAVACFLQAERGR